MNCDICANDCVDDELVRHHDKKTWCGLCSVNGDPNPIIYWLYLAAPKPKNVTVSRPS
jgi:hypothetical protein